jgi:SynChlorMet cassette protein ScmD
MDEEKAILTVNPHILFREEMDGWGILFNPDKDEAFGLNPVAVDIWKRIDGTSSTRRIFEDLKSDYEEIPDSAFDDIAELIKKLAEREVISLN